MKDWILGIDLGTSTTEAALYRDGEVIMLKTPEGDPILPSVVGINDAGEWVVGERARAQLLLEPEKTVMEVKRLMGSGKNLSLGGKWYSPVELSAKILEYVRDYASDFIGEEITRAVISVPAYFNDNQRRETVFAGQQAGFDVERILNEPTAASMSYGLDHIDEESHILVYDLGGGTFDVTLLEMFGGVLEVKASSGDNQLGGKDFDEKIMQYLYRQFEQKNGVQLSSDKHAVVKIKDEAEKCKKALSTQKEYRVLIPMITVKNGTPLALDEIITLEMFEEMTRDLINRTHHPIDQVMKDSELGFNEIDKVILVGGSTRMPMVVKDIENYMHLTPEEVVNPDYAVAQGAAIQAAIIGGEIEPEEGLVMTDVNPYSLGIACVENMRFDVMSVIIPRNTTVPVTMSRRGYSTLTDYQEEILVKVYQGESEVASHNHYLGELEITIDKPKPAGEEEFNIEFSYNVNGILEVEVKSLLTGKKANTTIHMMNSTDIKDEDAQEPEDDSWKETDLAREYRPVVRAAERYLKQQAIENEKTRLMRSMLSELKSAMVRLDEDNTESIALRITQTLEIWEDDDE